jgi:hypothetical protein
VYIRSGNRGFHATIRIDDLNDLDPNDMPDRFCGAFLVYGDIDGERIVFSDRTGEGADPIMYVNDRRDSYRFTMKNERNAFVAESLDINPATGKRGL